MLLAVLAVSLGMSLAAQDTTMTFGVVERDLTGDGVPEVLTLSGTGNSTDSLEVTFTIRSSQRSLYSRTWRLTRASFNPRRRISDAEFQTRLTEYGNAFFADSKFMSPTRFRSWLGTSARLHISETPEVVAREMTPNNLPRARAIWDEMQAAGITVFQFSPGGDAVKVIGWSAADERFYDLLECC